MEKIIRFICLLFIVLSWLPPLIVSFSILVFLIGLTFINSMLQRKGFVINFKDVLFFLYFICSCMVLIYDFNEFIIRDIRHIVLFPWAISIAFQNIEYDSKFCKKVIYALGACSLILVVVLFFQKRPGNFDFSLGYILTKDRSAGFFFKTMTPQGPTTIATILVVAYTVLIVQLKYNKKFLYLIPKIVILSFVLLISFISAGRMAWFAAILITVIVVFYEYQFIDLDSFSKYRKIISKTTVFAIFIIICATSVLYISQTQSKRYKERLEGLVNPVGAQTLQWRFEHWNTVFELIIDKPFGIGLKTARREHGYSSHNEILGQLMGVGFLGLLFYLGMMILLFIYVFKLLRYNEYFSNFILFSFCICVLMILTGLTENYSISSPRIFYPQIWIVYGVIGGINNKIKRKTYKQIT